MTRGTGSARHAGAPAYESSEQRASAFTLIELLVVIAIIAILAAILFPVFGAARSKARQASCQSNMKQMATATQLYYDQWEGGFQKYGGVIPRNDKIGFCNLLRPYMKTWDIFHCPEGDTVFLNVCMNWQITDKGLTQDEMKAQSKTILYFDCTGWTGPGEDADPTNEPQTDGYVYKTGSRASQNQLGGLVFPGRHTKGNNIVFADTHVRWFKDWAASEMTFDPEKR
ncbi:MAG TPA: prepilin-type N-terminal cleavage/methylation domain-containing protein [Armatimonadota bacterium]|jgi:prepilin-type N-terminal cleavage/methylation domain-containing protein/prepilin-type processing-associated H-X9-DG protein